MRRDRPLKPLAIGAGSLFFACIASCAAPLAAPAPVSPPSAASAPNGGSVSPSAPPSGASPPASRAVTVTGAAGERAAGASREQAAAQATTDASFDEGVASIRGRVPEWDNGTGMAIRYVQIQTGKKLTFLYVDRTPPEWKAKLNTWLILSKATWDGEIVSTVAVTLSALKAGRFEGAATKNDCMIGAAIGTALWDPKDSSTAWSNNEGGFCEVELREASQPGHLEGRFKAKLVSGQGVFYTIDQGYLYINR